MTDLTTMTISQLAREVRKDWKKVYFGAVPYLDAMGSLTSITDNFYADSGVSVVLYFLANATTWRGDTARAVKAELTFRATGKRPKAKKVAAVTTPAAA